MNVPTVVLLLLEVPVTPLYVPGFLFTLETVSVASAAPPFPNTLSLIVMTSPIACPVPGLVTLIVCIAPLASTVTFIFPTDKSIVAMSNVTSFAPVLPNKLSATVKV